MPIWLIVAGSVVGMLAGLWWVMERNPHHQFIDACGNGDEQKLRRFLKKRQELNKSGWFGLTPLGEAIRNKRAENVSILLQAGAQVAIPNARQTHLHTAVQDSSVEIVNLILKAGADINAKNYIGETPLKIAANALDLPMIRFLLDRSADVNVDDSVPGVPGEPLIVRLVQRCAKSSDPKEVDTLIECVGLLLDHGANINVRSSEDAPLIGLAMKPLKMLKFLVDRGAITDVSWNGTDLRDVISALLEE